LQWLYLSLNLSCCVFQILAKCIRGRVLATQGRRAEALQSLESAVAHADSTGLWTLEALAYRDMYMVLATGHGSERSSCERRLGQCLQKLTAATPEELDDMLANSFATTYDSPRSDFFDSRRLMSLQ
jgi:hypothetical protein